MGKFMVIDGNSLLHRAFHALPPMNNAQGISTNAIYGFLSMLLKIIEQEEPSHLLVAFDTSAPTPRHIEYQEYKAGRKKMDDELYIQFPLLKDVLRAMNIAVGEKDGFEADDFLGIFSRRAEAEGMNVQLVTGDRDALQLITDQTMVILTKKGITNTEVMDKKAIERIYGLEPIALIEVKGLMGDASDNIPGIPGVGEKTALKLIHEYKTVENTIDHADEVSGKVLKEKIKTYADQARMSRRIGMICIDKDAPIDLTVSDCVFDAQSMNDGREKLQELDLRTIVARLPKPSNEQEKKKHESVVPIEQIHITNELDLSLAIHIWMEQKRLSIVLRDVLSISDGKKAWSISLEQNLLGEGITEEVVFSLMKPIFESKAIEKIVFDAKRWMHLLSKQNIQWHGNWVDIMIAIYLLNPVGKPPAEKDISDLFLEGASFDAFSQYELCMQLKIQLEESGMKTLFDEIEMPLIPILFSMEQLGFRINGSILAQLGKQYELRIETLAREIYALAGEEFSILSPKQLASILFEKLALPAQRKTKTGYSTDIDTLEALANKHPIVQDVIDYRQVMKLKSTYIDGLLQAQDNKGRVHSQFHQNITATGRISSTNPNLQNIPIRTEDGREIRKAFVASEGNELVGADYSQIELRVLAHIAQDRVMMDAFLKGEDIHARTASEVLGIPLTDVTSNMRTMAKAVNFGIVYGISDFGLARQLNISRKEANDYITAYLSKYTGIHQYMTCIVEEGKEKGYVETLFGRRRDLPELKSMNHNVRSFGERVAMNAPIQGTAADIIKIAMNRVYDALQTKQSKLILQVHDELIVDTRLNERKEIEEMLKQCMENVIKLEVPLVADVHHGANWYEIK